MRLFDRKGEYVKKSILVSVFAIMASTLLLPISQAQATTTGCPQTWNLSNSKFPILESDELTSAQQNLGRALSTQLVSVSYSVDRKNFIVIPLNEQIPNVLDATPVELAVDRSLALLVSGKPIKVTYGFRVGGCPQITNFTLLGAFQPIKVVKISFADYLKQNKSYKDSANPGGLPEIKIFQSAKLISATANEIADCKANIIKAAKSPNKKGSKLSKTFSDTCALAGGKWTGIKILQQGSNCLVKMDDPGLGDAFALKRGTTCKVALARTLGDDPNSTKLVGPKVAYIFSEFSVIG